MYYAHWEASFKNTLFENVLRESYEERSEPYCLLKQASVHFSRSQGCWSRQQETVLLPLPSVTRDPHAATVSSD